MQRQTQEQTLRSLGTKTRIEGAKSNRTIKGQTAYTFRKTNSNIHIYNIHIQNIHYLQRSTIISFIYLFIY